MSGEARKVIVLGMDGLDPRILDRLLAAGQLPAFARLSALGGYRQLATSNPSQSPVAWTTIATGCNPGRHGVFDFLRRDPRTYTPELAILKVNPRNPLARRAAMFLPVRKCPAFWNMTSAAGIPTTVIRWPLTLPPDQVSGRMLAGLGVPDLKANLGRYTLYTSGGQSPRPQAQEPKGEIVRLTPIRDGYQARIPGPERATIPLQLKLHRDRGLAILRIEGRDYEVKEEGWSDWVRLKFTVHLVRTVTGLCRFHLASLAPEVQLYMTPIQVDPRSPAFIISHPDEYASELAAEVGDYHTLGMPEDTNALSDGCFDTDAFLQQCDMVMAEREKMLWHELGRLDRGLLAFVFDTTDRIQHVFWNSPRRDEVIDGYYRRMDAILSRVLEGAGSDTALIVLSDHGFSAFQRAVHLNSWLIENGFMALKSADRKASLFRNVDWPRTAAYALGFSSIYLNLRGREGSGTVDPAEAPALKRRIADKLANLHDESVGGASLPRVIERVYTSEELYHGPCVAEAPDLVVGFKPGYRTSWQTAVGGCPEGLIEDNHESWSGDHLVDPSHVPGVFFANCPILAKEASVADIAPTILRFLALPLPPEMEGKELR